MSPVPRPSEHEPSSARSSMSDLPAITSPTTLETIPLANRGRISRNSASLDLNPLRHDDLDIEDPLSHIYARNDEFEPFSRTETGFISVTCVGIVAVPLIFLLVSRLHVMSFRKLADIRLDE